MTHLARSSIALLLCTSLAVPAQAVAAGPDLKQQQTDYAKQLYQQGEKALAREDYATAVKKFEEAYRYAPELHVFNFNIANAAYAAGDCAKAKTYFQRFLDLVSEHPERGTAQQQLMEIERSGCAQRQQGGATDPGAGEEDPLAQQAASDQEDPLAAQDAEAAEAAEAEAAEDEGKYRFNGLMKWGLGVGALGAATAATGGVLALVGWAKAQELAELSGEQGPVGFTPHDYGDDEVYLLDLRRRQLGLTGYILMPVGAALLGTGMAMYFIGLKRCRESVKTASRGRIQVTGVAPSVMRGGGGLLATMRFGARGRRGGPVLGSSGCN